MLKTGSPEISEDLRRVFFGEGADSLKLDNEFLVNDEVCNEFTQRASIFVVN